ncbi:MAG: MazG-like family protein [Euryarchaeota archaeon]|nr:MazG-like family protein [Euryarchaeota archaeon]
MDESQRQVAEFLDTHDLESPPEFRVLDLASEVGEIAEDVAESTDYGEAPDEVSIKRDEIGDALFGLLALSVRVDVDAGEALEEAVEKYRERIDESGDPSSGE